jgi:DNA polymerase III delta prime subunit
MNFNNFIDKYQPSSFNQLIIDDKLKFILQNLIKFDIINILFIGDIGCGKTTFINSIINEYYNLPFNKYSNNVLFVNNLKEQGIHAFRQEIKTFIQTSSIIKNKKKFVIIDDIDNLHEQTQQILRNSIDNYSNKINFIASCNSLQKVIDNIQSRLNIFNIHLPNNNQLFKLTKHICYKENINIDNKTIDYIIRSSNNSYRILLNNLQKIKLLNPNNINSVYYNIHSNIDNICCNIKFIDFDKLIHFSKNNDFNNSYNILFNLYNFGYSIIDIYEAFFHYIKTNNSMNSKLKFALLPFICKYISIFHSIHESNIQLHLFTFDLIHIIQTNI